MVHSQLNECSTIFNSLIGVGNPFFLPENVLEKLSQVIYLFNPFHFEAISSLFFLFLQQALQMLLIRA